MCEALRLAGVSGHFHLHVSAISNHGQPLYLSPLPLRFV